MKNVIKLTPVQRLAADRVFAGLAVGDVILLSGKPGAGKSTILQMIHNAMGGALLSMRDFIDALEAREPMAIEEAFLGMIEDAMALHSLVFVDDLHLVTQIVQSCDYQRSFLLDAALTALLGDAGGQRKKLVFATGEDAPWPVRRRAFSFEIGAPSARDYEAVCSAYLPPEAENRVDYARVQRFAPLLNTHQLKNASVWMASQPEATTERFLEHLKAQDLTSNVNVDDVPRVDWKDLKGIDDLIRSLEAKVALPFENDTLAAQYDLKPKRGVLLAGPPGTGKTTIGRALAHRLKGKFFLIDGTVICGTGDFYNEVNQVFEAAKRNAPSVIFIDDSDVIFEDSGHRGFYRYLLTMLDGLESASAGRVCVMLTAMNVGSLPPAVVRSGRVELWLETRLPDAEARAAILAAKLAPLPDALARADLERLSAASRGLTGADLKAVVEDGKLLYAHDVATGNALRPVEEYFIEAIDTVRANRSNYARSKPPRLTGEVTVGFVP